MYSKVESRRRYAMRRNIIAATVSFTAFIVAFEGASAQGNDQPAVDGGDDTITVFGRSRATTLREVPQSAQVFGEDFLSDVSAVDISDIVRFVPSAAPQYAQGGWEPNLYSVRGFNITEVINGARQNTANYALDTQLIQRVEVLMGPASVLYGSMQPGAVINLVTKKPQEEFHLEVGAELGSYDHQRYTLDVGGAIASGVNGRLNVVYQDRESFLDFWEEQKLTIAPTIEFALSPDTTFTVAGIYADTDQPFGGYLGGPAAGILTENPNGDYSRSFYVQGGDDEGVGRTRETLNLETTLKHDFTEYLSARGVFSYTHVERDDQSIIGFLQGDSRTIDRLQVGNLSDGDDFSFYADISGEFVTGPITHKISVGGEYFTSTFNNLQTFYNVNSIDLYTPTYGAVLTLANQTRYRPSVLEDESIGAFIQDRMTIGERLHLIAGTRYAKITSKNTGNSDSQSDWPTMFGVVVDVADSVSLFGNRSESFVPRSGTTADNTVFPPESSLQYEAGAKFGIGATGLNATVALFQVEKPDVLTPDLDNPGSQLPLGSVKSKGFEASVQGEIAPDWTVFAAFAHMVTDVESNDVAFDGTDLRYAPENTFSLTTHYDVSTGPFEGLGFTGAVQYAGDRFLDAANTLVAPSYVRVDLGVRYAVSDHVEFKILANNITNAEIFSGYGSNNVDINPPRTFLAGIKVRK